MTEKRRYRYDELDEGSEFVGEVVNVSWEKGDYGDQLHVEIKPLDHEIKGKTGCYHEWFKYSERKNSKWGELLKKLDAVGTPFDPDEKVIIGKKYRFIREKFKFGDDMESKDTIMPKEVVEDGVSTDEGRFDTLLQVLRDTGATQGQIVRWSQKYGVGKKDLDAFLNKLLDEKKVTKDADGLFTLK